MPLLNIGVCFVFNHFSIFLLSPQRRKLAPKNGNFTYLYIHNLLKFSGCSQAYHCACIGEQRSFQRNVSLGRWECGWHRCHSAEHQESSELRCLACPTAYSAAHCPPTFLRTSPGSSAGLCGGCVVRVCAVDPPPDASPLPKGQTLAARAAEANFR